MNAIGILFEIVTNDQGTFLSIIQAAKMTLEQCMENALALNSDTTHQFVLLCGPDLSPAVTANAS